MEHGRPACAGGTSRRLTWSTPEACDHPGTRFVDLRASMLAMLTGNAGNAGYAGLAAFPIYPQLIYNVSPEADMVKAGGL